MKLYCLSGNPNRPCFVLTFKKTTIMLDCGLDVSSLLHFLPLPLTQGGKFTKAQGWSPGNVPGGLKLDDELKEVGGKIFVDSEPEFCIPELKLVDMSEVDIILLSSHHCMLALPYITQYTNFRGVIYATEPTLTLGKLYMEELIEYISTIPKHSRATKWKHQHILNFLPVPLRDAVNPIAWRQIYSRHDVNACMAKVHMIGYNEKIDVFGNVEVMAASSGFSLGSCNWVIQSQYEKVAYVSGSSTLTTHPKPMEQAPLRNSDILVMCSLSQTPLANPDAMIGEFCVNTAMTLRNGGNVLVPCFSSGVTYDLFECLSGHLESCGLGQVPLYFISPIAQSSLAYSNIYAEWLSSGKQNKVYLPEAPFPHAELVKCNRLKPFPNLHEGFSQEMKTPCVVFTGHPSMRFGNIVHFLELWGKSSGNTLIITEPDFPYLDALAPYQPLSMKICYCPIDTSLNFGQANKLIRDLKPVHLVVAEQLTTPPLHHPHNADLVIDAEPPPGTYKRADVLSLPIKRTYEKMEMEPELASSLIPVQIKPGVAVATVNGHLLSRDYNYILKPLVKKEEKEEKEEGEEEKKEEEASEPQNFPRKYVWGNLDVQEFALQLTKQGIQDVKVEENPGGGHIVHLQSEDTLIQIEEGSTHIICEGNEQLRVKLRDTLLKCLAKF